MAHILNFNDFIAEYRSVGGNSGYVGYSMSVRAAEARRDGKFPKTDFKREYGMSDKVLSELVSFGYIDNSEWHHTSKFGNRTTFYSFLDEPYRDCWLEHSDEIKALIRKGDDEAIVALFDNYRDEALAEHERRMKKIEDENEEYMRYKDEYRKAHDKFDDSVPFVASNGYTVKGYETVYNQDGEICTKRHCRSGRDLARSEYLKAKNKWTEGLLTPQEYFARKEKNV
jgi:hypothetical protein